MLFAERRSAGLELFKSIGRQEEPMEIGATNAVPDPVVTALDGLTKAVQSISLSQERLTTRLAKLEARNKGKSEESTPVPRPQTTQNRKPLRRDGEWTADGRPVCNQCHREGHITRNCFGRRANLN